MLDKIENALDKVNGVKKTADLLKTLGKTLSPPGFGKPDPYSVETITRQGGLGSMASPATAMLFGHNHTGVGTMVPANNENHGYTFFVRPRLNLSYDNIIMERTFSPMLARNRKTIPAAIRSILDPVGFYGIGLDAKDGDSSTRAKYSGGQHTSDLVDPFTAFIPLLSNTLISLSGWPDPYMDTYTSKQGLYREEWSMVDSPAKIYNTFDLSANFRNVVGDPVGYMIHVWTQYASLVREGELSPYPEAMIENFVDYNTRIYRMIMDPSRTYILKIASCGAAFPTSNSVGSSYDYAEDAPNSRDRDQISVTWKCMGARYYDPMVMRAFNVTAKIFNPQLTDAWAEIVKNMSNMRQGKPNQRRLKTATLIKLLAEERPLFRFMGYPLIDEFTSELTWWVKQEDYNAVMGISTPLPFGIGA